MKRRKWKPVKPQKGDVTYHRIWRMVDGAVADAFAMHPDYLSPLGKRAARESVVKRVTGAVRSFAEQSVKGRAVSNPTPKM